MLSRRNLLPLLAARAFPAPRSIDEYDPANVKLSHRMPIRSMTDDDLLFLQQLGIRHARIEFGDTATFDYMKATQDRLKRFGMTIYSAVHYAYRRTRLQLGQAGRDQDIDEFNRFLVDCGKLRIPIANVDWHPANTYTTAEVMTPRGYRARQFKLDDFRTRIEKQAFDRVYSADDIWNTYTYFMKAVLPVAEKANVRLALHPDDPPLAMMNGVEALGTHLLHRHVERRRDPNGQGRVRDDPRLWRARQDLRRPLPECQRTAARIRRDLPRRRLPGHGGGDAGPAPSEVQRRRTAGPHPLVPGRR